jgi:hypothetical protein
MSLFFGCLTLGGGLSAFVWYKLLEIFETKFETFELNGAHIELFCVQLMLMCWVETDVNIERY